MLIKNNSCLKFSNISSQEYSDELYNKRNSAIDILRLVFAIIILLYHSNVVISGSGLGIFKYGYIGVEFFFIVSGWLLMSYVDKKESLRRLVTPVGKETVTYVFGKIKKIYPYYFSAFVIAFIVRHISIVLSDGSLPNLADNFFTHFGNCYFCK